MRQQNPMELARRYAGLVIYTPASMYKTYLMGEEPYVCTAHLTSALSSCIHHMPGRASNATRAEATLAEAVFHEINMGLKGPPDQTSDGTSTSKHLNTHKQNPARYS